MTEHIHYMQKVLELADTIGVQTRPNPKVACILVKNSRIIGTGIHLNKGSEHAEIYALNQAGNNAKDATLYVNLEPCSHYGATPPCADAIIKSGVKTVVIANEDPNPLVSGKGIQKLKDAGIEVITNVLANEAQQINQVFFHNITQNLPYTMLKVGMSIDGRIATKDNLSKWITGIESRTDAHHYRAEHEGILIGVDSVIKDDPSLTPYLVAGYINSPIRIILDSNLRTPIDAKLITDNSAQTWIITTSQNNLNKFEKFSHVKIIQIPTMDIKSILHELYKNGIYTLMVEGGEKIYSSLIDAKLANQIVTYISPQIIGSTNAKHFAAGNGFGDLVQNLKCKIISSCQLGNDLKVVYEVIN